MTSSRTNAATKTTCLYLLKDEPLKKQEEFMYSLLQRTLFVDWENATLLQRKIGKLSRILARGRSRRDRRHSA